MQVTRVNAVIYLTKTFFDFYAIGMANTLRFTFQASIFQNLDIVAPDAFHTDITLFIKENKLPAATILMILSDDLLFCKEMVNVSPINHLQEAELREFLDLVPFEKVLSKLYKLDKKEIIVAINHDYLDKFQEVFKINESKIENIVPVFLLGKAVDLHNGMPQDVAHMLLERLGNIRPWSMPTMQDFAFPVVQQNVMATKYTQESNEESNVVAQEPQKKKSNKRPLILGAGILPLLGVFIFMFLQMNAENAKQDAIFKAKALQLQTQVATQPTAIPQAQSVLPIPTGTNAFAATIDEQKLKISIQFTTISSSTAANLRTSFQKFGIQNITNDIISTSTSKNNTVLFTSKVSSGTKQRIVSEIQRTIPDIQVQDNNEISNDVLINLP